MLNVLTVLPFLPVCLHTPKDDQFGNGPSLLFPSPNQADTPPRAFISPFPSSKAARTAHSSFRFGMCDKPLPPCLSTVSIPSAFYVSLPRYHLNQLPLHPLHHSRTTLQQLPPLMRAAAPFAPFWFDNLTQPCSCFSPAARTTTHWSSLAHTPR